MLLLTLKSFSNQFIFLLGTSFWVVELHFWKGHLLLVVAIVNKLSDVMASGIG